MDSGELILLSVAQWRSLLSLFLLHSFFLALSLSLSAHSQFLASLDSLYELLFLILSQNFLLSVLSRLNPNWSLSNSLDTILMLPSASYQQKDPSSLSNRIQFPEPPRNSLLKRSWCDVPGKNGDPLRMSHGHSEWMSPSHSRRICDSHPECTCF